MSAGADFIPALLPREPGVPSYRWLASALRSAILEGRLRPGARLPGTRALAGRFGLSRGTVTTAFEELAAQGYLTGEIGSGTYVNRVLPDDLLQVKRPAQRTDSTGRTRIPPSALSDYGRRLVRLGSSEPRRPRAFRTNEPALDLFPARLWAQLAGRALRRGETILATDGEPLGYLPLREAIADYLGAARGVRCAPGQVAIVSGVQEALDLTTRLLVDPGDRVVLEEPGYDGAERVFSAAGARIVSVAIDGEGMKVPSARLRDVRLAYVTPAHQFPTGVAMSLPRRLALLEWARRAECRILEDDYDSEFRYSGRPIPALQGLDDGNTVIFVGSFSKVLFPSLRLGYVVVPDDLVTSFEAAKSVRNRYSSLLEQLVLAEFIATGHFGRHLRRMREIYAERSGALVAAVRRDLAGRVELAPVEAGLQTTAWLPPGSSDVTTAELAARQGLEVTSVSRYCRATPERQGLQLGFAAIDPDEIRRGVRKLEAVLDGMRT
jgi:GntR family transcriptional regulator/MocR family aminotransferase